VASEGHCSQHSVPLHAQTQSEVELRDEIPENDDELLRVLIASC
jgi:hypothetical protein